MAQETFIIVMPAYNEEECIEHVVNSWMNLIKKFPGSRMLVINDGSKDKTKEKLDKLKKRYKQLSVMHKRNEGHGPSLIKGYKEAVKTNHDWVFQVDSDDQFMVNDFHKLWKKRNKSKFILGYRLERNDSPYRIFLSKMIRANNSIMFGAYIKDANAPYRLMKREYLEKMLRVLPEQLLAPNIFLSILAVKDHQNVMNIPITHKDRKTGEVSIKKWKLVKVSLNGFKELVLFRMNLSQLIKKLNKI